MDTKLTKTCDYFLNSCLINIRNFSELFSVCNFKFALFTLRKYLQVSLSVINTVKLRFLELDGTV